MKQCGILLPVFSLPSPYGIGTLGKAAFEFVDFLHAAGQQVWQVLPLHPTGYGNSPYYTLSCFAGNPWLIDLDRLKEEGLLTQAELDGCAQPEDPCRVDYDRLQSERLKLLYQAFCRGPKPVDDKFCRDAAWWLEPYCDFMARREREEGRPWNQWEKAAPLDERKDFHRFLQSLFYRQWDSLKAYANDKGVQIIGDLPFYVPHDSADVFARREEFCLDLNGAPSLVAGCPPDQFNAQGQFWGRPIYRWDVMARNNYQWWLSRIAWASRLFDGLRLDHFRGFESFWAIPAQAKSAAEGSWLPGPGKAFLDAVKARFPDVWFLAEDLGDITPQVRRLLSSTGFWGMRVLQFGFENDWTNEHLPHNYQEQIVGYTSLHDTMTAKQWLSSAPKWQRLAARRYLGREKLSVWDLIADVLASPAGLAVVAMQDYLELGWEARMNEPGTVGPQNWSWRMEPGVLNMLLAEKIRRLCQDGGRKPA